MSKNEIIKIEDLKTLTAEQLAEFAIECAESIQGEPLMESVNLQERATRHAARALLDDPSSVEYVGTTIKEAKTLAKHASNTQDPQIECRLRATQWAALTAAGAKTYPDIARTRDYALTASRFALRTTCWGPDSLRFPFEEIVASSEYKTEELEAEIAKQWDILENIKSK